jgi:hypothetical protein
MVTTIGLYLVYGAHSEPLWWMEWWSAANFSHTGFESHRQEEECATTMRGKNEADICGCGNRPPFSLARFSPGTYRTSFVPPLRAPFRLRNILPKAVNISSTCFEFLQKASGERFKLLKALPCPTHLQAIIATEYCAFCRGPFPLQRLPGFDAWQSNVRAGRLPSGLGHANP